MLYGICIILELKPFLLSCCMVVVTVRSFTGQGICSIVFFFPRASERRVLPIVGVCKTSSHIFSHLLTSSHIFSHLLTSFSHLLTSSHIFSHLLTSFSHLLTSSHIFSHLLLLPSCLLAHLLTSSHIFSHLLTSSHIFSHLLTSSHIFSSCPLALLPSPSFLFLSLGGSRGSGNETPRNATLSHEMRFDRQKQRKLDDGWPESETDVFQAALSMVVVKDSR